MYDYNIIVIELFQNKVKKIPFSFRCVLNSLFYSHFFFWYFCFPSFTLYFLINAIRHALNSSYILYLNSSYRTILVLPFFEIFHRCVLISNSHSLHIQFLFSVVDVFCFIFQLTCVYNTSNAHLISYLRCTQLCRVFNTPVRQCVSIPVFQ